MTKLRSASSTHTLASHIMIFLTFSLLIPIITPIPYAQIPEKQAELIRLLLMRAKAEEAMSMGDPEGASLNAGKAALMAALLAKEESDPELQTYFKGLEAMLRAQESVYRAIGLYQQSGEQVPASSGVCRSIHLAAANRKKAQNLMQNPSSSGGPLLQNLLMELQDWERTIEELRIDFICQKMSPR